MDQALQTLYWACRQNLGFPGVIPDESSGHVSTDAILRGLGLSPPSADLSGMPGGRSESQTDGVNSVGEGPYKSPEMHRSMDHMTDGSTDATSIALVSGAHGNMPFASIPVSYGPRTNQSESMVPMRFVQRYSQGIDGQTEVALLPGEQDGMLEFNTAAYSSSSSYQFQKASQLAGLDHGAMLDGHDDTHIDGHTDPRTDVHDGPLMARHDNSMMDGHDGVMLDGHNDRAPDEHGTDWAGTPGRRVPGTLPWPGTLAAVQTDVGTVKGRLNPSRRQPKS